MRKSLWQGILVVTSLFLLVSCNGLKGNEKMKAEQLGEAFLQGEFKLIYGLFTPEFKREISLDTFASMGKEWNEGVKRYLLDTNLKLDEEHTQYIFTDNTGTKGIIAIVDSQGKIAGLLMQPLKIYPETDQQLTKNKYIMPIDQEWFVYWGGTNELLNYHYVHESQRYAYDLVITQGNGSFEGDAERNDSYYAFGKPIVAPADGTVVEVVMNIQDNDPVGTANREQPFGNYIMIDHGQQEYSVIGHLQYESAVVKVGDQVKQGEQIGLAGNSGNSSEPHIHFQVQDSQDFETARSLRIRFADGSDPIRGQSVKPANH